MCPRVESPLKKGLKVKLIKLQLVLTVDIDPQGETTKTLKSQLNNMVRFALDRGLITGELPATIEDYEYSVKEIA